MISLRVPKSIKRLLIISLTASFVSGCLFFVLNTWITIEGDFGPEKHPWQFSTLKIHAAAAFAMMLLYGAFWGSHVPLAWRTKKSRNSGIGITVFIAIQIVSAYLLYYLANEFARSLTGWIHISVGLSLPIILALHIRAAKRSKRQSELASP